MKRLFTFPNKPRRQAASIDTTGSRTSISSTTNDANNANTNASTIGFGLGIGGLGGIGGGQSPTISKRPTGRDGAGPWKSLQVLATEDALLVRPKPPGDFSDLTSTILKVSWSKAVKVAEVKVGLGAGADAHAGVGLSTAVGVGIHTSGAPGAVDINRLSLEESRDLKWESALDIYGIVGTMTLFAGTCYYVGYESTYSD
jgi:hypothetical protein